MKTGLGMNCSHLLGFLQCTLFCAECPLEVLSIQWPGRVPGALTAPELFLALLLKAFPLSLPLFRSLFFPFLFSFFLSVLLGFVLFSTCGRGVLTNIDWEITVRTAASVNHKYGQ